MKTKLQVIEKHNVKPCMCTCRFPKAGLKADPNCTSCKGTGKIEDNIYYHIVNGMCFDGDIIK